MKKRLKSTINLRLNNIYPLTLCAAALILWQIVSATGFIKEYLLPSPISVLRAFVENFPAIMEHTYITVSEAIAGLIIGIILAFIISIAMDSVEFLYKSVYPLLIISQTVPVVAIAPLLVLWLGYGIAPKIVLIFMMCFFPIAIGMLDGFKSADPDAVTLLRAMGATKSQIFRHIKLPSSLNGFYAGLKISVSYAVVGAVISEWLGGNSGLGVYMTRVRKSYAYDKMFAVIIMVSILSLVLIAVVKVAEKYSMPWKEK